MRPLEDGDQLTLRIFTLLFVNSFLIGAAVAIHAQGIWFPAETSWAKVGGLYMMAATFVQMIAFMIYKVFAQERLQDQQYIQGLVSDARRHSKRMNAELQRAQLTFEMEARKQEMESRVNLARETLNAGIPNKEDEPPTISLGGYDANRLPPELQ